MHTPDKSAREHPLPTPVRFWRAGQVHEVASPPANQTLLEHLRSPEGMNACGTKEGCAEGDCGACTVVIAELVTPAARNEGDTSGSDEPGASVLKYRAINSCIRFTHQIDGCALWTVEDLARPVQNGAMQNGIMQNGPLHPVQQAMLEQHGSQCGFCTPGFVMSLFALYQEHRDKALSRDQAIEALSGNLCRCTGYRPILDAAQAMMALPRAEQAEQDIALILKQLKAQQAEQVSENVLRPRTLDSLLKFRHDHPQAQIIAGATDVGLWVTKQGKRFDKVLDVTAVQDLKNIIAHQGWLEIGAAVRLEDAFASLVKARPQLARFALRFAGRPIRQSGTLGGNIANGSPIGDSMPLLIALGAKLRLASQSRGSRELPIEDFFLAYRRTQLAPDEILSHVLIPQPDSGEISRVYKVSKRFEDDISAVCLAINIRLDAVGKHIASARLGVGGMAATPMRAKKTEGVLCGAEFTIETIQAAQASIQAEFSPLDDMRASAVYRSQVIGNLLLRFWQELQNPDQVILESMRLEPIALRNLSATSEKGSA